MGLWSHHDPRQHRISGFADIILNSRAWLTHESLKGYGYPATAFRIIGYPALIALMKVIAGNSWAWLIVGFQFVLSLVASAYVFCLVKRVGKSQALALFALIAHGLGQALILDQCRLSLRGFHGVTFRAVPRSEG